MIVKPALKEYDHLRIPVIQWAGDNFDEVKEFVYDCGCRQYIRLKENQDILIEGYCRYNPRYTLHKKDWFIKGKSIYCEVVSDEEFKKDWVMIDEQS